MPQPQKLYFSYGGRKLLLYRWALGGKVCGCMRDSTRDKPCAKWWLRSGNGLIRLHHEERQCWNGKNEHSLLEVLETGRGVGKRQLFQKCSDICHRGQGGTSVCVSSIKVHIWIHWTCNQGIRDSNQIMVAYWSVYGDFLPTVYKCTTVQYNITQYYTYTKYCKWDPI
jgi:hypothetical protein